tara:strand:+ start:286 stop:798 length:513 start_codon:yes stop_codon:yes gene_type:complete
MAVAALTAFVTVTDKDGNTPSPFEDFDGNNISLNKFQNGRHEGVGDYKYLSFIYQGAAMNNSGDNLEASIILANSPLSMAFVKEFVEKRYYVKAEMYFMDEDFSDVDTTKRNGGLITSEYWLIAGMRYDPESIEMLLSSAIDAVGADAPQKTLSTEQCKHLPLTGTIQNR